MSIIKMRINPVEINILDKRKFLIAAIFLDKPNILDAINKARKHLKITIKDYEKTKKDWEDENEEIINKYNLKFSTNRVNINLKRDIDKIVDKILINTNRSSFFHDCLKFAIVSNEVRDENFDLILEPGHLTERKKGSSCYIIYPPPIDSEIITDLITLNPFESAIIVTPETTKKELLDTFKLMEKGIKRFVPFWKKKKIITNIIRDREWYWLNRQGRSYVKIAKESEINGKIITWEGVREAIKQYKLLLSN